MAKKINWNRVIANAGLTFFTTLTAATAVTGLNTFSITTAIFTALIQGGVAGFTQMKDECEEEPKRKSTRIKKVLASALVF